MRTAVDSGARIWDLPYDGAPPIHFAVEAGCVTALRLLLSYGPPTNDEGRTQVNPPRRTNT